MAYTVDHLYKKVLEGTDKMGSDFYTVDYVMNRLEAATYDFIGESVKFMENTQEIRDDIRTLYKPFNIPVITDPNDTTYKAIVLPDDYLHMMQARVVNAYVDVRKTRMIRHGQEEIFLSDPDTVPTEEYPIIVMYDNIIRILSPGFPTSIKGMYVKKPIFGLHDIDDDITTEIAVNLPDNSVDKIIKDIINDIFISTDDPRGQVQFQTKEKYRER